MDVAVILTYRCNSRCSMCHIWQNPTSPEDEISLGTLDKIPSNIDYLNLTGGEPTLREDLEAIVDLPYPRAMTLEISSNGSRPERLEPTIGRYPDVKIRFSLDGIGERNHWIRGELGGFERKRKATGAEMVRLPTSRRAGMGAANAACRRKHSVRSRTTSPAVDKRWKLHRDLALGL